jgi:hypothetical protein
VCRSSTTIETGTRNSYRQLALKKKEKINIAAKKNKLGEIIYF